MECSDDPDFLVNDMLMNVVKKCRREKILYAKLIFHNGRAYDNILIS